VASNLIRPSYKRWPKKPERYRKPGEPEERGNDLRNKVDKARDAYATLKKLFEG
jgi:hypothetical protein